MRTVFETAQYPILAVCIDDQGNEISLKKGKVYQVIEPKSGDQPYDVRVLAEDGEDYVFSAKQFVPVEVPSWAMKELFNSR